jgi:hypothetical protein
MNLPDLIVNDISLQDCDGKKINFDKNYDVFFVTSGQPITITVEIENIGSADAKGTITVNLAVQFFSSPNPQNIMEFTKKDLKKNNKESWIYTINSFEYPGFSKLYSTHKFLVDVDKKNAIAESNEGNNGLSQSIRIQKAEWTIICYMSGGAGGGSSDLNGVINQEVGYMSNVGSNSVLSIVVLLDLSDKFTAAFFITKTWNEISRSRIDISWPNEVNMGDHNNLITFGGFAMDCFKANHYIILLTDHGGGFYEGCVWDDMYDNPLTTPEIHTAMSYLCEKNLAINGKKIDVVILETCLMASVELAYEIKDYANYLVAPELLGTANLLIWNSVLHHDVSLRWLKKNYDSPTVTLDFCKVIVDSYIQSWITCSILVPGTLALYPCVQWGVIDLTKISALVIDLDDFCNAIIANLPATRLNVLSALDLTESYENKNLYDLSHFLKNIIFTFNDDAVIKQLAQDVQNSLSTVMIYNRDFLHPTLNGYTYWHTKGLSIYFHHLPWFPRLPCPEFDSGTKWDDLLLAIYDELPPYAPTVTATPEGWSSQFTFSWTAVDETDTTRFDKYPGGRAPSGIAGYYWRIDGGPEETWTTSTSMTILKGTIPGLTDGIHILAVRAKDNANNIGALEWCAFDFEATPPVNPNSHDSTPPSNIWSNDNTIDIAWSGASDSSPGSGVHKYYFVWDHSPSTVPDATAGFTEGIYTTSTTLSDGNWYFHVRARDHAGNWASGAYTAGVFKIDKTKPTTIVAPTFSSADVIDGIFTLSWSPSTDTLSGVSRYELQQKVSGGPWITVDGNIAGNLNSFTVSVSPGTYYFRVRAIDAAGNLGSFSSTSSPAIVPEYWFGLTIPSGNYFNFYSFQDSFNGTAYHIDTIGSGDWAYQFMGTYTEEFVVRSDGTIGVSGWFRFSDLGFQPPGGYPLEGRREVLLYLIIMDPVSNTIEETALVLDYTDPVDEWIWVDNLVVSDLTQGSTINIGIGRSDAWEIDWRLTAEWAGVVVYDANGMHTT